MELGDYMEELNSGGVLGSIAERVNPAVKAKLGRLPWHKWGERSQWHMIWGETLMVAEEILKE